MNKKILLLVALLMVFLSFPSLHVKSASTNEARIGTTEYLKLADAFAAAVDGDVVYLLKDITQTTTVALTGNISVTLSSDPGFLYTIIKNAPSVFTIRNGFSLIVENLVVDGNNISTFSGPAFDLGVASSAAGYLTIKDGTTIRNCITSNGAAVIQIRSGMATIEGGLFTNNYATVGIGLIYAMASTTLNLSGGVIYDNYTTLSNFGAIGIAAGATVQISGDVQIYDNRSNKNADERDIQLVEATSIAKVTADFTGTVGFWSTTNYLRDAVFASIENNADISGGTFINNRNSLFFGIKDSSNIKWDYLYENATVILAPTATTSGTLRQTAVGAPTVTRDLSLNPLNGADYTIEYDGFDQTDPQITYSLKDPSYGPVNIIYDLSPVGDLGYSWSLVTSPSLAQEGELSATHSGYPGLEITDFVLPALNAVDYSVTLVSPTESDPIGSLQFQYPAISVTDFTFVEPLLDPDPISLDYESISFDTESQWEYAVLLRSETPDLSTVWYVGLDDLHRFTTLSEETEYDVYVKPKAGTGLLDPALAYTFTTLDEEAYLLEQAKIRANLDLDAFFAGITDPSAAVTGIVDSAHDEIDAATTREAVGAFLADGFADIQAQILLEEKAAAKAELDVYLATVVDPSEAVNGIIAAAKSKIETELTSDEFDGWVSSAIADAQAQILLEEKAAAKAELDVYLATIVNPNETVTGIIAAAKTKIETASTSVEFDDWVSSAIADAQAQILVEEKSAAKTELDDYLATVADPSETVNGIIAAAKTKIEIALTSVEFDGWISDAIADAQAQILVEEKAEAKTELDVYLATIVAPSETVNGIIAAAKTKIETAWTSVEINGWISDAIADVQGQILSEEKTAAKAELDVYLATIADPSEAVNGIIVAAKGWIDSADSSVGFANLISDAIADVQGQILSEEKTAAKAELDDYLATIVDPSEVVNGIIAAAKVKIETASTSINFDGWISDAIVDIQAQILVEEKAAAKAELDDYFATITNPSEDMNNAISAAKTKIEAAMASVEFDGWVADTIAWIENQRLVEAKSSAATTLENLLNEIPVPSTAVSQIIASAQDDIASATTREAVATNLSEAIAEVQGQILSEEKGSAKTELDDFLATVVNPSDAVNGIIAAAKTKVDTALTSVEFDDWISDAITDVQGQILLEEKSAAKAELDVFLATIVDPSEAVNGIIGAAKAEIDSADQSDGFPELIQETIAAVERCLLSEAKESSKHSLDELVSGLLPDGAVITPELQSLITNLKTAISAALSVEEIGAWVDSTIQTIETQAHCDSAAYEFADLFNTYSNDQSYQYNEEGLQLLDEIFQAVDTLLQNPSLTLEDRTSILEDAIGDLDQVPIVTTGEIRPNDPTIDETELNPGQFYVSVTNDAGMQKGLHIQVEKRDSILDQTDLFDLIDQGSIDTTFTSATRQTIRLAMGQQIAVAQLSVRFLDAEDHEVTSFSEGDRYRVSLLIPEDLRTRTNLRAVCRLNGQIVVFDTEREDNWISFTTNQFGEYYLLADPLEGEESNPLEWINLWWLIILLAVVVLVETATILLKWNRNHPEVRLHSFLLPLAILIPVDAYAIIWIEAILILLLGAVIVYLFASRGFKKSLTEVKALDQPAYLKNSIEPTSVQNDGIDLGDTTPKTEESIEKYLNDPEIRYNYSLMGRLHQAPDESMRRYNLLKNHILRYPGIKATQSWSYERFLLKGKTLVKLTLSGQTMRVYFHVESSELEDNGVRLEFQNAKEHESTPFMMLVKGPGNLRHATKIIDVILKKCGVDPLEKPEEDFRLPYKTREELVACGLVKVVGGGKGK